MWDGSYVLMTKLILGIIYDVIVEPPSVGSTTDENGHSKPVSTLIGCLSPGKQSFSSLHVDSLFKRRNNLRNNEQSFLQQVPDL